MLDHMAMFAASSRTPMSNHVACAHWLRRRCEQLWLPLASLPISTHTHGSPR